MSRMAATVPAGALPLHTNVRVVVASRGAAHHGTHAPPVAPTRRQRSSCRHHRIFQSSQRDPDTICLDRLRQCDPRTSLQSERYFRVRRLAGNSRFDLRRWVGTLDWDELLTKMGVPSILHAVSPTRSRQRNANSRLLRTIGAAPTARLSLSPQTPALRHAASHRFPPTACDPR
jgi:hypothetical protein